METNVKEISINGVDYVRKDSVQTGEMAKNTDGLPYVILRTHSAGVFAGYLASREGKEAKLYNSRRMWYWDGAASLSQLGQEGTKKPENCKFPCELTEQDLTEVIEVIYCTEKARLSIASVKVWQQ